MEARLAGRNGPRHGRPRLRGMLAGTAAAVAATCSLAACASSGGSSGGSGGALVIGGVVDQTGPSANAGAASRTAFDYWIKRFNGEGGVNGRALQVKYCDSQSTPAGGAECATQLAGVNTHIVMLLTALPAAQGAETRLGGDVALSIIPVLLPKAGGSVFQVVPLFGTVVAPLITMAKTSKIAALGVVYTNDSSGAAQLAAIQAAAKAAGLKVVASPMEPTATDVTPQLIQLKSGGAGLIFSATLGTPTNVVVSSAHTLGLSLPLVVGNGNVTNNFLQSISGGIPPNLYGIATMAKGTAFPAPVTTAWASFQAAYQKATGKPVDSVGSSFAYASCLLDAALKHTAASSAKAVKLFLSSQATTCLGSALTFSNPAFNVASGVPAEVVKATSASGGTWGPAGGSF